VTKTTTKTKPKAAPSSKPAAATPTTDKLGAWEKAAGGKPAEASKGDLQKAAALALRQLKLEAEILAAQEALKKLVASYDAIRLKELPEVLSLSGLGEFTLSSGHKISVAREYFCSLTGQYKVPAMEWLKKNDLDEIITHDVKVSFGKGFKPAHVKKLMQLVASFETASAQEADNVNTATFKAVVREKLEKGEQVPTETIGVTVQDAAKITPPKRPVEI
jgi:hypothetical protein